MSRTQPTYQELKQQLEAVMLELQDENTDLDKAIELHKTGQQVLEQLDIYLAQVGKTVKLKK